MHENADMQKLPMQMNEVNPTPKPDAKSITALVKDGGKVVGYQLDNGETLSKDEGVARARQGDIKGVGVARRKDSEYLRSLPDGTDSNNLSHLPSVSAEKPKA